MGSKAITLKNINGDKIYTAPWYPVGSIYISVNNTNPCNYFGGVWERIKDTFLLSAGDTYNAGSTGGEATHTLTVDEIPTHNHTFPIYSGTGSMADGGYINKGNGVWKDNTYTTNRGGGKPHNNMPPYLAVYVWKRTA